MKIKINVDFYNSEEEELIKENFSSDYDIISKKIGDKKQIEVSLADFKTYGLFRHQMLNPSPETFIEIQKRIKELDIIGTYFNSEENNSLVSKYQSEKIPNKEISETLGVAGALSVASELYGLNQADWIHIEETTDKTFDFKKTITAATTNNIIQIEAKGSITPDNKIKTSTISNHKKSIKSKKTDQKNKGTYNNYTSSIGYITIADNLNPLRTLLVDPEPENLDFEPLHLKTLKRLFYYGHILDLTYKDKTLTTALYNRIISIKSGIDYRKLNGTPLKNSHFEDLTYDKNRRKNKNIFKGHMHMHGSVYTQKNLIFALSIDERVIHTIINQDFDEINEMKFLPREEIISTHFHLTRNQATDNKILEKEIYRYEKDLQFTISSSGLGFSFSEI